MIRLNDTTAVAHINGTWQTIHTARLLHDHPELLDVPTLGPALWETVRSGA